MNSLSFKIAYPIIIAGIFIIVSFIALNYENLNPSFYFIFAFLALYVFLFGFAIGQNFTAPVRKLLKKADDLSRGDLKTRFYIESKDEIGQLSNIFNKIADKLEASNNENEITKKSIGLKVEAETQSLKEVINALEHKIQNRTLEIQKLSEELERSQQYSKEKEAEIFELKNKLSELNQSNFFSSNSGKAKTILRKILEEPDTLTEIEKQSVVLKDEPDLSKKQNRLKEDEKKTALKEIISRLEKEIEEKKKEFEELENKVNNLTGKSVKKNKSVKSIG